MRRPKGLLLIGVGGLALLALSATAAVREAAPFLLRAMPVERRIDVISEASEAPAPLSVFESQVARTARLDLCLTTLRDMLGVATASAGAADTVTRGCLTMAEAVAARSPSESNVWFVAAALAVRLGDFARAERYLAESYRTGPAEQWIAERRALLAYGIRDRLSDRLRALVDGDLALLLRTERGVKVLATRYVFDPGMRDHLVEIAETLDEATQERFAARIKAELRDQSAKPLIQPGSATDE